MALEYLTFYRGNLATGFDYIYAKKTAEHAFYVKIPAELAVEIADVQDEQFDFYRQMDLDQVAYPQLIDLWQDVSFQWPNIERHLMDFLPNWQSEYRQIQVGATDEWGVLVKFDDQTMPLSFIGINTFPEGFTKFEQWLNSYASGRIR